MRKILTLVINGTVVAAALLAATGCGTDDVETDGSATAEPPATAPRVVVTTNILGDVVAGMVGDLVDIEVIMPLGSDPHDFAPSARQAEAMENADLLVINGAGFEEGMVDVIASVAESGGDVFEFADQIELLDSDPHIWTDPSRMITAVQALETELVDVVGLDGDALGPRVDAYVADLTALEDGMADTLSSIPDDQRVLVTNHEVFGYFADRFGFEVVGAVIPSLSTNAEASPSAIEELAALIAAEGIAAIFGETTQSTQLAEALADAVGNDVDVVPLFSESLGEPGSGAETYIDMMNTNATRIADALTP